MMQYTMPWTSDGGEWHTKTVRDAISDGVGFLGEAVESPQVDARHLLAYVLGIPLLTLNVQVDARLPRYLYRTYWSLIEKRAHTYPLQYITGIQEFFSLEFCVSPDVFIPRFETEQLVEESLRRVLQTRRKDVPSLLTPGENLLDEELVCIDLCTGIANIPLAIKSVFPRALIFATDIYPLALQVARTNLDKFNAEDSIKLFEGDLFDPLAGENLMQKADLIIANPPYIATGEISCLPEEVKLHESHVALNGGKTGTEILCEIAVIAPLFLKSGALFALEIGESQTEAVCGYIRHTGAFEEVKVCQDLAGRDRFIFATKK